MNIDADLRVAIGKAIAELRESAGLTQAQAAERSTYDQGAQSKFESALLGMSHERFREVARAIGTTPGKVWDVAEAILASSDPRKKEKLDQTKASAELLASRINLHAAMNLVVHDLAGTTPAVIAPLERILQLRLASSKTNGDRLLFRGLVDRLANLRKNKPARSSEARARGQRG